MADGGIWLTWNSAWFKTKVWPEFKRTYPPDALKVEKASRGEPSNRPSSNFARGIWEEMKKHPKAVSPSPLTYGLWTRPVVMLHNARGGVEYQEEQAKYFGSVTMDVNGASSWDDYEARAKTAGLKTTWWQHVHSYDQAQALLDRFKADDLKTGGLNLEDMVSDGMKPANLATIIDRTLGPESILFIPTLGWIQDMDWSPLGRHVFGLEFFLNDPPMDGSWNKVGDDVTLCKMLGEHARSWGARKVVMICGIYPIPAGNPYGKDLSSAEYKKIIASAGERFGGIYLGDNNGPNYAQWA